MTDSSNEDSMTKLNTQLNKSMVLMEDAVDTSFPNHNRKSITISTELLPPKTINGPIKSRRSILKKSNKSLSGEDMTIGEVAQANTFERLSNVKLDGLPSLASDLSRPRTLEEISQKEMLEKETISSTFNLDDVSDSEEIWIMDVPRLIDPKELHGQMITFDDKSKFRIKDERYCIVAHDTNHTVTCVFNAKKNASQYKTVNVKPTGFLTIRRKLSGKPEVKPISTENSSVQFPDNLRTRHPLFGVIRERKRRSKKRSSLISS
ncbi:hypothetical protein P5V15_004179 [Pogonomyrmex californicus]